MELSGMCAFLEARYPVAVRFSESKGRHVVASRNVQAGDILMLNSAAAMVSSTPTQRCEFCLQAPQLELGQKMLRCSACKSCFYCSIACQKADWSQCHKRECKHYTNLSLLEPADRANMLLVSRLQGGRWLRSEHSAPASGPVYQHTAADVQGMQPHIAGMHAGAVTGSREEAGSAAEQHMRRSDENARLLRQAASWGLVSLCADSPAPPFTDEAELLRLLSAFECNNFFTHDDLIVPRAASIHPAGALLNHSCRPNAVLSYLSESEACAAYEGRTLEPGAVEAAGPHARAPRVQVIRALHAIEAGVELTHSYVDTALTRAQRRTHLLLSYGFTCTCDACESPAGDPLDADRFLMATVDGKRVAPVGVPTPFIDAGHPGRMEKLTSDFSSLSAAETTCVTRALEVLSLAESVPRLLMMGQHPQEEARQQGMHALRGAVAKLRSIVLELQEVHKALFTNACVHELKTEAEEAVDSCDRYDSLLVGSSEATGRFEPGEGGFELIATRALEMSVLSLCTVLHPLHTLVMQAVNALHQRYLMLGDMPSMAAAGEHILCWQRHVYDSGMIAGRASESSSGSPTTGRGGGGGHMHPVLGLQLYTQGDVYVELVGWAGGGEEWEGASPAALARREASARVTADLLHMPPARAALLQALFVQYAPERIRVQEETVPHVYSKPVDAPLTVAGRRTALRYAGKACEAYAECAIIMAVTHGQGSEMARTAADRAVAMRALANQAV